MAYTGGMFAQNKVYLNVSLQDYGRNRHNFLIPVQVLHWTAIMAMA